MKARSHHQKGAKTTHLSYSPNFVIEILPKSRYERYVVVLTYTEKVIKTFVFLIKTQTIQFNARSQAQKKHVKRHDPM